MKGEMKMKTKIAFVLFAFSAATLFAKPTFNTPVVSFNENTCLLTVRYTVSEPAVVIAHVTTNGVPLKETEVNRMVGDVNRAVVDASVEHAFYWQLAREFADAQFDASAIKVDLVAYAYDLPPDYMVIDFSRKNDVRYYETAEDVPGGLGRDGSDINRLDRYVMRRIPAKDVQFRMGFTDSRKTFYSCNGGAAGVTADNTAHNVTLRKDFYIGVYPMTVGQWNHIWASNGSMYNVDKMTNAEGKARRIKDNPICPMEGMSYKALRGTIDADKIDWPNTGNDVAASSYLGQLRARTGVLLDLPTEAQWEFAMRAGSSGELPDNQDFTQPGNKGGVPENNYGFTKQSVGTYYGESTAYPLGPVGYFTPNAFGVYDMIGNVGNWCVDRWEPHNENYTDNDNDPVGPDSGTTSRVWRGGPSYWNCCWCCLSIRRSMGYDTSKNECGVRLWAPADVTKHMNQK